MSHHYSNRSTGKNVDIAIRKRSRPQRIWTGCKPLYCCVWWVTIRSAALRRSSVASVVSGPPKGGTTNQFARWHGRKEASPLPLMRWKSAPKVCE